MGALESSNHKPEISNLRFQTPFPIHFPLAAGFSGDPICPKNIGWLPWSFTSRDAAAVRFCDRSPHRPRPHRFPFVEARTVWIDFHCRCGRKLRAPSTEAGRQDRCPSCRRRYVVPAASEPAPSEKPARPSEPAAAASAEAPAAEQPHASTDVAVSAAVTTPATETVATAVIDAPPTVGGWRPPPRRGSASIDFFNPTDADKAAPQVDYLAAARRAEAAAAASPTAASPSPSTSSPRRRRRHFSTYLYWLLLLVFIPLAWAVLHRPAAAERSIREQLYRTIASHPEVRNAISALPPTATVDDLFSAVIAAVPDHKLEGAYLSRDSVDHWTFASMSIAGFLIAVILLFPVGDAKWHHMVSIGVFTGTIGIFLLLAFQRMALHARFGSASGFTGLLTNLLWLIGQSYRMALGGNNGFLLSFVGFTAGVGFCEEVCKAIPLLWQARAGKGFLRWRSAMLWGLVSGIGFGVSEGITYCADSYNGIAPAHAYLVRFISCVGLHAIWSAAVGVALFRQQHLLRRTVNLAQWLARIAQVVIVPMLLHGLYDTLLKQHFDYYALLVALLSFVWLACQIERAERTVFLPFPVLDGAADELGDEDEDELDGEGEPV